MNRAILQINRKYTVNQQRNNLNTYILTLNQQKYTVKQKRNIACLLRYPVIQQGYAVCQKTSEKIREKSRKIY